MGLHIGREGWMNVATDPSPPRGAFRVVMTYRNAQLQLEHEPSHWDSLWWLLSAETTVFVKVLCISTAALWLSFTHGDVLLRQAHLPHSLRFTLFVLHVERLLRVFHLHSLSLRFRNVYKSRTSLPPLFFSQRISTHLNATECITWLPLAWLVIW